MPEKRPPFKIIYGDQIFIEYEPGCVNFSYWLAKVVPDSCREKLEQIPGTIWLREQIKGLEKAMIIEQLALCQWGYDKVVVEGERPPLKLRNPAALPGWPVGLFPFDLRHPIIKEGIEGEETNKEFVEKRVGKPWKVVEEPKSQSKIENPPKIMGKIVSLFDD